MKKFTIKIAGNDVFEYLENVTATEFHFAAMQAERMMIALSKVTIETLSIKSVIEV